MTAPRKGDRVRLTFEGVVSLDPVNGQTGVLVEDDAHGYSAYVPIDFVEVLAPALKVGDEITVADDPEPPRGTTLLYGTGEVIRRRFDGWTFASTSPVTYEWRNMSPDRVRVVHVGAVTDA